eukprot:TRINITY_DN2254_c0_g1_i1.p1 TRINITY_DN2254_c0_g1~~TRINITY_DN2254_c0_g1_i1.p1  ORF type:complete len:349 (+),score=78.29 TRINITY_DN2254_c0_g1_i1:307-1353(+)
MDRGELLVERAPSLPTPPTDLQGVLSSPAMREALSYVGRVIAHASPTNLKQWQHPKVAQVMNAMVVFAARKAAEQHSKTSEPVAKKTPDNDTPVQESNRHFRSSSKAKRTRRQLSRSADNTEPAAKQAKAASAPHLHRSRGHSSSFADVAIHCDSLGLTAGVAATLETISSSVSHQLVASIEPRVQPASPCYNIALDGVALARFALVTLKQAADKLADDVLLYCQQRHLHSDDPSIAQRLAEVTRRQVPRMLHKALDNLKTALQACPDIDATKALAVFTSITTTLRPVFARLQQGTVHDDGSEPDYSDGDASSDNGFVDVDAAWLGRSSRQSDVNAATSQASVAIASS